MRLGPFSSSCAIIGDVKGVRVEVMVAASWCSRVLGYRDPLFMGIPIPISLVISEWGSCQENLGLGTNFLVPWTRFVCGM